MWLQFWRHAQDNQMWFTPFDSMVNTFITFSPTNHPHNLHFRWRNSITGWTISKISTSFHHALMALEIRRGAMQKKIPTDNRDIQEKRGGTACEPPAVPRVKSSQIYLVLLCWRLYWFEKSISEMSPKHGRDPVNTYIVAGECVIAIWSQWIEIQFNTPVIVQIRALKQLCVKLRHELRA